MATENTTATTKTGDQPESTPATAPSTTTENISTENLTTSTTDKNNGDSVETNSNVNDSVTVTAEAGDRNSTEEDDSATDDTQRKIRRAERFGLPVQLSEEEKRNSRAERFGTAGIAPGSQGSDTTKKAEELKRKARADRFGITQSTPTEEEEKKKARLSRFGSSSKADPIEEEKKKARALRFSGTPASGNGKIEPVEGGNHCWQGRWRGMRSILCLFSLWCFSYIRFSEDQ
ncbi:hypothetical protein HanPI659440_Chr07g0269771 [Helianthus annuus]|nr:hypothetical protein HanPI659440_Chr07g0269771 [Helianthus annuus]